MKLQRRGESCVEGMNYMISGFLSAGHLCVFMCFIYLRLLKCIIF